MATGAAGGGLIGEVRAGERGRAQSYAPYIRKGLREEHRALSRRVLLHVFCLLLFVCFVWLLVVRS